MASVKKNVKQHSKPIDNIELFIDIAVLYATSKNYFFSRYSGINSINLLKNHRKTIRDVLIAEGYGENCKLPARYWKLALDEAISNIKTEWANVKHRVKDAVKQNENLTSDEKGFIYYALKNNNMLQSILLCEDVVIPDKIKKLDVRNHYIYNLIRRYIRKYKGAIPTSKKKRSFTVDADMYEYVLDKDGNLFLEITSLIPRKRLSIPLKDKNIHKGNLRIVIQNATSIEVHKCKDIVMEDIENKDEILLSIDKGYTSLFAVNGEKEYGKDLHKYLTAETERLNKANAKRNQIWALMKKCKDEGNHEKAERIRINNFGKKKYNNKKHKFDETVKSYINHETYTMLDEIKPTKVIAESLTFQAWYKKMDKKTKRKLARWIKGYIQERLEYICSKRQIKVELVNAAYTSQQCSNCDGLGERDGKKFKCPNCGLKIDADLNASKVIGKRYNDPDITLYTPYKKVKEILLSRFEAKKSEIIKYEQISLFQTV